MTFTNKFFLGSSDSFFLSFFELKNNNIAIPKKKFQSTNSSLTPRIISILEI
jgi:hypothetical protein